MAEAASASATRSIKLASGFTSPCRRRKLMNRPAKTRPLALPTLCASKRRAKPDTRGFENAEVAGYLGETSSACCRNRPTRACEEAHNLRGDQVVGLLCGQVAGEFQGSADVFQSGRCQRRWAPAWR